MKTLSSLCGALMAAGLVANAGEMAQEEAKPATPAPVPALSRAGDGAPVCGLGKSFHAGRRAALRAELKNGIVIVRGLPDTRDYAIFQQDKVFWYLTGVESPGATLVMDLDGDHDILFLPPRNAGREGWEGELWDAKDEWVKDLTGFADVRATSDLVNALKDLIKPAATVWISKEPWIALSGCSDRAEPYDQRVQSDPLDGRKSREAKLEEQLVAKYKCEVKALDPVLNELRRVKTQEEITALRRAGRSGAMAMVEAMRSTSPGIGEWEIAGLMSFIHQREGAAGPAYQAIVGSGKNSCVLHYSAISRRMQDGEVLLIDFAPEVDHYTSDITRTWPVGGTFRPRQAELYDAVLEAQQAGIAAVKPGVTMGFVNEACMKVLKEKGFATLVRHGFCHFVGLEVHDVGDGAKPLVPGVVFTIEPGLYENATGIGVRIEDVVVVTSDGCEVLTDGVPKNRAAIEALISDPGILDGLRPAK